jgi:putative ABC transport system ATP-binding protein
MSAEAAGPADNLPATVFGFAWKHTRMMQIYILFIVLVSMPTYFFSLDLPKQIVNGPIQGAGFPSEDATQTYFGISFDVPTWLWSSGNFELFGGIELQRSGALVALSLVFLALVVVNGLFKFYINTYKGRLGERMLRRLRFDLVDRVLRFPMAYFRRIKPTELATMVKDEVEPIGGFVGESFVTPFFLGGQAATAMAFILLQSPSLGLIAAGIVAVQAVIIPRLRRRLIVLGRERQLTARQLAGRVGEIVEGISNVHVNDTSNYERADIAHRLGRIFSIRYELYQRKFFVKFLNNFLAQITPFVFYLIGGYFALNGQLDIGQLVAVIAAYKDLPGPIKELIDWDQQRMDVQVKYTQVIEQFNTEGMLSRALQEPVMDPVAPLGGHLRFSGVGVTDDAGAKLIEQITSRIGIGEKVAVIGGPNSGTETLGELAARLIPPSAGRVAINDDDLIELPEAITGRRISVVPADLPLFQGTVADNLLYGLKHVPLRPADYDAEGARHRAWDVAEAHRAGNIDLDVAADWIDYEAAGATGPDDLMDEVKRVLALVDLDDDIIDFGLRGHIDPARRGDLTDAILKVRHAIRARLEEGENAGLVEFFNPDTYADQATVAENVLFGTPDSEALAEQNLAGHSYVRRLIGELKLDVLFFERGREIAATAIELFADLPHDHPFFEQLSFMSPDEIPEYQLALARVANQPFEAVAEEDRQRFIRLPFAYIEPRHRMGLLDDEVKSGLLELRRAFRAGLPDELKAIIEFYDPASYNKNASVQDNMLLGRVCYGVAGGQAKVFAMIRAALDQYDLYDGVLQVGLEFNVGTGGKRLSQVQRQKIGLGRALLRRPDLLIVNRSLSALDRTSQAAILKRILSEPCGPKGKQCGVMWVLANPAQAGDFERVLVMHEGRLVEDGSPDELMKKQGVFAKLVA